MVATDNTPSHILAADTFLANTRTGSESWVVRVFWQGVCGCVHAHTPSAAPHTAWLELCACMRVDSFIRAAVIMSVFWGHEVLLIILVPLSRFLRCLSVRLLV